MSKRSSKSREDVACRCVKFGRFKKESKAIEGLLEKEFETKEQECARLHEKVETLTKRLDETRKEQMKHLVSIDTMKKLIKEREDDLSSAKRQIIDFEMKLHEMENANRYLEYEKTSLEDKMNQLEEEMIIGREEQEERIHHFQEELERAREQLREMREDNHYLRRKSVVSSQVHQVKPLEQILSMFSIELLDYTPPSINRVSTTSTDFSLQKDDKEVQAFEGDEAPDLHSIEVQKLKEEIEKLTHENHRLSNLIKFQDSQIMQATPPRLPKELELRGRSISAKQANRPNILLTEKYKPPNTKGIRERIMLTASPDTSPGRQAPSGGIDNSPRLKRQTLMLQNTPSISSPGRASTSPSVNEPSNFRFLLYERPMSSTSSSKVCVTVGGNNATLVSPKPNEQHSQSTYHFDRIVSNIDEDLTKEIKAKFCIGDQHCFVVYGPKRTNKKRVVKAMLRQATTQIKDYIKAKRGPKMTFSLKYIFQDQNLSQDEEMAAGGLYMNEFRYSRGQHNFQDADEFLASFLMSSSKKKKDKIKFTPRVYIIEMEVYEEEGSELRKKSRTQMLIYSTNQIWSFEQDDPSSLWRRTLKILFQPAPGTNHLLAQEAKAYLSKRMDIANLQPNFIFTIHPMPSSYQNIAYTLSIMDSQQLSLIHI
eukprot:TRINITY_DN8131_c0_g1_i16.p1 TRINITY_DN8131_c0_g1~~TRINITY_DN8131_c0_g1_i16.p1  ORF type:complete len:652 (+),score=153.54 TRINITY_DN8131_c0_g1_i16:102-2057(+)